MQVLCVNASYVYFNRRHLAGFRFCSARHRKRVHLEPVCDAGVLMVQLMEVHGDYSAEVAPDVGTAIERPAGEGEEGEEAAPAEEGADWS